MKLIPHLGALKSGTCMNNGLMYRVFGNQGQGPRTHGLKSLDRFYDALLPCPTVVLSGKDELKIFQHYMHFTSDRAAAGLKLDPLTALVFDGQWDILSVHSGIWGI